MELPHIPSKGSWEDEKFQASHWPPVLQLELPMEYRHKRNRPRDPRMTMMCHMDIP